MSYTLVHFQKWIQEMAFHVKSIDPKHLLGTGVEGFYGLSTPDRLQFNPNTFAGQVGTDFIRNHQVLGVDYASAHMYPDTWLVSQIPTEKKILHDFPLLHGSLIPSSL